MLAHGGRCALLLRSHLLTDPTAAVAAAASIKLPRRFSADSTEGTQVSYQGTTSPAGKEIIYKGRWILPFRLLVRAKVFQLLAASGATLAATTVLFKDDVTTLEIAGVSALAAGCVVAAVSMWYFSRRYVGELALLPPDRSTARFSVLDFWGNREDVDVPVSRVQPPFRGKPPLVVRRLCRQMAFPVNVTDERQFFMSVRGGEAHDKEVLMQLLEGRLPQQQEQLPPLPQQPQPQQRDQLQQPPPRQRHQDQQQANQL